MVLHVDDVLFLGEQQWLSDVFLPGLKEEFKLSSTLVDRSAGGTFEFLKRFSCGGTTLHRDHSVSRGKACPYDV